MTAHRHDPALDHPHQNPAAHNKVEKSKKHHEDDQHRGPRAGTPDLPPGQEKSDSDIKCGKHIYFRALGVSTTSSPSASPSTTSTWPSEETSPNKISRFDIFPSSFTCTKFLPAS